MIWCSMLIVIVEHRLSIDWNKTHADMTYCIDCMTGISESESQRVWVSWWTVIDSPHIIIPLYAWCWAGWWWYSCHARRSTTARRLLTYVPFNSSKLSSYTRTRRFHYTVQYQCITLYPCSYTIIQRVLLSCGCDIKHITILIAIQSTESYNNRSLTIHSIRNHEYIYINSLIHSSHSITFTAINTQSLSASSTPASIFLLPLSSSFHRSSSHIQYRTLAYTT